jgi:hypothetical protein
LTRPWLMAVMVSAVKVIAFLSWEIRRVRLLRILIVITLRRGVLICKGM